MELIDIYIKKIENNINRQKKVILFTVITSFLLLFFSLITLLDTKIELLIITLLLIIFILFIFTLKQKTIKNTINYETNDNTNTIINIDNNILSYNYLIEKINKNAVFINDSLKNNNIIIENIFFNIINTNDMILNISEQNGLYINVSKGLLLKLNDDEFKSVLSHELSHFLFKDYYTFKSSTRVFNFSKTLIKISFILLNLIGITKTILGFNVSNNIYIISIIHFILYFIINILSEQENLNSNHSFEFRADLNAIKIFNQDPLVLKTALEKILLEKEIDKSTDTYPKLKDRIELIEKGAIL